jgi:hypothetical protein
MTPARATASLRQSRDGSIREKTHSPRQQDPRRSRFRDLVALHRPSSSQGESPRLYLRDSTLLTHHRSRFQITVGGWSAGTAHQMVGCSTYLRDKMGDILDVSAPAGDFMLTPSAPRFPWIAPGPASRPSCDRRAQCADTATTTSDGGPRRTVPLKIMRFARWASARQLQLRHLVSACGSRRHPALAKAIWIVQRARRPTVYAGRCLARISRAAKAG